MVTDAGDSGSMVSRNLSFNSQTDELSDASGSMVCSIFIAHWSLPELDCQ
jgi:hypothetical protein